MSLRCRCSALPQIGHMLIPISHLRRNEKTTSLDRRSLVTGSRTARVLERKDFRTAAEDTRIDARRPSPFALLSRLRDAGEGRVPMRAAPAGGAEGDRRQAGHGREPRLRLPLGEGAATVSRFQSPPRLLSTARQDRGGDGGRPRRPAQGESGTLLGPPQLAAALQGVPPREDRHGGQMGMTLGDFHLVGIAVLVNSICCFYLGYLAGRAKR